MSRSESARRVVLVAHDDAQILDVTGPLEVFARADRFLYESGLSSRSAYALELVAAQAGRLATSCGVALIVPRSAYETRGAIDTLIVSGGIGTARALGNRRLIGWIRRAARRARRVASVCTGAFLLAEAGLLDGRRATTHWEACNELALRYPKVSVAPDPIYVKDGPIYTSAGVTAGMDLALALVEEDHGHKVALAVARRLVLFLKRPGGQSQFSAELELQTAERDEVRELEAWLLAHPGGDGSVPALARRAAMSPRNLTRVFHKTLGTTPARFVERVRIEAARRRLERSRASLEEIAASSGFGSAEVMRRAFIRTLSVSPSVYRSRFS